MPLTDEQEERLSDILNELSSYRGLLTDWEMSFLDDQVRRYDEHGSEIRLSPKQWAVLNRMYDKVCA